MWGGPLYSSSVIQKLSQVSLERRPDEPSGRKVGLTTPLVGPSRFMRSKPIRVASAPTVGTGPECRGPRSIITLCAGFLLSCGRSDGGIATVAGSAWAVSYPLFDLRCGPPHRAWAHFDRLGKRTGPHHAINAGACQTASAFHFFSAKKAFGIGKYHLCTSGKTVVATAYTEVAVVHKCTNPMIRAFRGFSVCSPLCFTQIFVFCCPCGLRF